jgi:hypothetical protein
VSWKVAERIGEMRVKTPAAIHDVRSAVLQRLIGRLESSRYVTVGYGQEAASPDAIGKTPADITVARGSPRRTGA